MAQFSKFCKNTYNLTGICSQKSCPLSNRKYATIIEHEGFFFLLKKEQNRMNFPDKTWKKITLSRNFVKAIFN
jgi:protein MAK16